MTSQRRSATPIDVVVVTFNNADSIRGCIEPLSRLPHVRAVVVDNASDDNYLTVLDDLAVRQIALDRNAGFAAGCNVGWRVGSASYVLFLNPDARIDDVSLARLVDALDGDHEAGAAGPRIVDDDDALEYSQRRFQRLRSTYAQALLLHHFFPRSSWADEVVRDETSYLARQEPEWISGACVLVRRSVLERVGGWDESFFMYSEDADLCRRLWHDGQRVLFIPDAVVSHSGGTSAPRDRLLPQLAWSRVLYARKHSTRAVAAVQRAGIALGSSVRIVVSRGGLSRRAGHARAFWRVCTGSGAAGRHPTALTTSGKGVLMRQPPSYAAITPARDEAGNLRRLGDCMLGQTIPPAVWVIVDDGSCDATPEVVAELSHKRQWVRTIRRSSTDRGAVAHGRSGGRDVLAFNAGLEALGCAPDFVCKLDADVSLEPDYFERILDRFRVDPSLGIASGLCYEEEGGKWVPRHMTEGHVRGAARVWRRECFEQVRPLQARLGWDGVDELEANVHGWRTVSFSDIPILHHRPHGARDGATRAWIQEGDIAHFLAYRPTYVLVRALHHARREPLAVAMVWGYVTAGLRRQPRYHDPAVRQHLRRRQRWRELPRRRREVTGRAGDEAAAPSMARDR